METFLGTIFIVVCILLILVVLLQKGRGGGLGAAFGGAGSSAFGTRTGDVFTWVTIVLTALFLLLAIFTSILHRPERLTVTVGGFSPPAGEIDTETTVRVSVEPAEADIWYTLDGSDPKEKSRNSKRYRKIGVRVQPGQTLKVRAYKATYNPSKIMAAAYPKRKPKVDTGREPPTRPSRPASRPATGPATRPTATAPAPPTSRPAKPKPSATKPAARPTTRPASPKPPARPAAAPAATKPAPTKPPASKTPAAGRGE
jgi:preprotein translocase subunit SecG